ncbi:ABC transporter permease [Kallotenue papyrolyticum]|uniref:ABC transporter permease n=1 Tax=Kallotenue papyrolyticum TaxID=1325125 RepID=UPI00049251D5|nr:ABC transporter permease [Kallotenue papyrolyticum]
MKVDLAWSGQRVTRSMRLRLPDGLLRRLILPLLLLLAWQASTALGLFERSQLPAPLAVLRAAHELIANGQLVAHVAISAARVAQGFAWGSLLAIGLGLAVGLSRAIEELVAPTLQALRTIPSLAWVPLLILWLGIDEASKVTLIAIGAFFPVYTNLVAGIRHLDRKLVEVGVAYGMQGWELAREVLLPAALPALLTGLRIGLAQAWLFLVAAELIAASRGLGFLLIDSQNTGRADIIVLSIGLLALLGKASDWLLQRLEQRLLRWQDAYTRR